MANSDKYRLIELQRENDQLRRAVDELTLLNELATASAGMSGLTEILQTIIRSSMQAVQAEQGVITLVDEEQASGLRTLVRTKLTSGKGAPFRADDQLLGWMHLNKQPIIINNVHDDDRFLNTKWDPRIGSILSVPLVIRGKLIGILTLYNKLGKDGFQTNDRRLLIIISAQSAQILVNATLREERANIIQLFGQHTSPAIVEQLLASGPETDGVRMKVCVMFFDIRGFTSFSERRMPEEVVTYLNKLFEITVKIVNENGGIIHQLLGDGFMAIFGAPISQGNDSVFAVDAALAMVRRVKEECDAGRLEPTRIGIGLHTGEVVAGSVGTSIHKEYKITGDVVNLAARIESLNKKYDSQILISESVLTDLNPADCTTQEIGMVTLRGREKPVTLFRLA